MTDRTRPREIIKALHTEQCIKGAVDVDQVLERRAAGCVQTARAPAITCVMCVT